MSHTQAVTLSMLNVPRTDSENREFRNLRLFDPTSQILGAVLLISTFLFGCGGGGGGGGSAPIATAIAVDVQLAPAPHTASFTDISGLDPATVDSWLWDFGDPASGLLNSSAEQNPTHLYAGAGLYTPSLTITVNGAGQFFVEPDLVIVEQPGLQLNEFLAQNRGGLEDEDGDTPDWIELYNAGPNSESLAGWTLTDDSTAPFKWTVPAVTLGPQEYLVIFASGKDRKSLAGPNLHTNFKLDGDGEYLALLNFSRARQPARFAQIFPPQEDNIAYGLPRGGVALGFLGAPTPGAPNGTDGFLGVSSPVEFGTEPGIYGASFELVLMTSAEDAEIAYSMNGFDPVGEQGTVYSAPIEITEQSIVTAQATKPGYLPSRVVSHTYLINPSMDLVSLPVVSIIGDPERALFEPDGIMAIVGGLYVAVPGNLNLIWQPVGPDDYNNVTMRGRDFERRVSIGYFDSRTSTAIEHGAGLRVHGSSNTRSFMVRSNSWNSIQTKFAFRAYFRGVYGPEKLELDLFGPTAMNSFDQLVLRSGRSDFQNPFIKDELARRLFLDMGQVSGRGRNVNLLLNNVYRGYYNLVERYDEEFLNFYNDYDEQWDIVDVDGVKEGTEDAWNSLENYVITSMDSPSTFFETVATMVDIENFIDYVILETYLANIDWVPNNWLAARPRTDDGRFSFLPVDLEQGMTQFYINLNLYTGGIGELTGLNGQNDSLSRLYRGLKRSPAFGEMFGERVAFHFGIGGGLSQGNIDSRFRELRDEMSVVLPNMNMSIPDSWIPRREAIYLRQIEEEGFIE